MDPQGLYLNNWTPDFDPTVDLPKAVPVWVRLPNLPVHCWNWDSLRHIGNALGKFIDRENNKDQYDCARICIEVDLEAGLPEAITIKPAQGKEDGWNQVKGFKSHPKNQKPRGPTGKGPHQNTTHQISTKTAPENKFDPLSSQIEGTEEIEIQKETEMTQETEVHKTAPSGKGTPSASPKGVNPKDKILEEEEEEQEFEESEEEGEIGESQT
eukprot:PITA_15758